MDSLRGPTMLKILDLLHPLVAVAPAPGQNIHIPAVRSKDPLASESRIEMLSNSSKVYNMYRAK